MPVWTVMLCTAAGAILVGCFWGVYRIAYNNGVHDGRNYEQVMRERYDAGRLEASLPSCNYKPGTTTKE